MQCGLKVSLWDLILWNKSKKNADRIKGVHSHSSQGVGQYSDLCNFKQLISVKILSILSQYLGFLSFSFTVFH